MIEGCNIFSNAFPGIAVNSADPVISRNRIHHNERSGLVVAGRSEGNTLVEDNNIFENGRDGVMVAKDAVCLFQGNSVFENRGAGFQITTGGSPSVNSNRIFGNREAGILVGKGGNGTFRNCQVFSNDKCGISISKGGEEGVTVEETDVFANNGNGIEALQSCNATLVRNRVFQHGKNIVVAKDAAPVLEKNEVFASTICAFWIDVEAYPVFKGNTIHSNSNVMGGSSKLDLSLGNEIL